MGKPQLAALVSGSRTAQLLAEAPPTDAVQLLINFIAQMRPALDTAVKLERNTAVKLERNQETKDR